MTLDITPMVNAMAKLQEERDSLKSTLDRILERVQGSTDPLAIEILSILSEWDKPTDISEEDHE